jgi:hypothetical protein
MFFPGMTDHYGPKLPVDIEYKREDLNNFKTQKIEKTMSFDSDFGVKFWVRFPNNTRDLAMDCRLVDLLVNFTLKVPDGNKLVIAIKKLTLSKIDMRS